MKKVFALLLTLSLALTLCGCAPRETPAAPDTDGASSAEPAKPEEPAEAWDYELTTETSTEERKNEDGVLLVTWSYEQPALRLKNEKGEIFSAEQPARGATQEQLDVCGAFNDASSARMAAAREALDAMEADARELFTERDAESGGDFPTFASENTVGTVYRSGDLLDVLLSGYSYWGGAHGGMGYENLHFDLKTGEFFTLADLTDRPAELCGALADEILNQIYAGEEWEYYFDDFEETIRGAEDYNVSFGETGLTAIFGQYELAPYVMGILEFEVPCAKYARFLNERGARLLAPSEEDRTLSDYYEAEELWYWLEGGAPVDYEDSRLIQVGGYEVYYARVTAPGVTTLAGMREKLRSRFSDALVDKMLAPDENGYAAFREIDGALYAAVGDRGLNVYVKDVDFRVEFNGAKTGGRVVAEIQWQDYDDAKEEWILAEKSEIEFPFELSESGARFSEFCDIY